ncbi:Neither inactivation nor afterpotential protein C [Eumeta japonica]|uniref:non-specific serine/threonine protein kinase n=1 Tax=Eumeta variegata TaxID=151549 RepID=A0A4C1V578_EUMVA|nr:Neither inactivation nor afterpotential protein C [Eumeta japonica]
MPESKGRVPLTRSHCERITLGYLGNRSQFRILDLEFGCSAPKTFGKALSYLHENNLIHRNVRCSNILINKDGEIKLSDFGLSSKVCDTLCKRHTSIGSPSWMAPEVVAGGTEGYGNRADVWALGITTIEMADGKAPFQDMHPTRALFQIVRNPPPTVNKPAMWSFDMIDFVTDSQPETMQVEDLAALENLTEDKILNELQTKLSKGYFTSFIGDILLILNPNTDDDVYDDTYHKKYECKSRSDNEPHVFAVADSAHQDALHHNEPQHVVFSGESKSGKTTNMVHALSHLTYLGAMKNNTSERIRKAANVIQVAISASTPLNIHSTRGILQIQVTYGNTGKLSGAIFWLYQLEKWRVSSTDMTQGNFDLLYYFYDAMAAENKLDSFYLEKNRKHRYLRILEEPIKGINGVRDSPDENVKRYREFKDCLVALDWEPEDIEILETVLASVLVLGNIKFKNGKNGAEIENVDDAKKVAKLLSLEEVKFLWALLNYCLIERGTAVKRQHSTDEARDARDVLAGALYKRIVDWMINVINFKLSFGRSVFGDKYSVSLIDMFGFECYHRNHLEQLIVNTTNEQIQFLYNQRIFAWEMQEQTEEDIPAVTLHYYNNKNAVDQLMGRPLEEKRGTTQARYAFVAMPSKFHVCACTLRTSSKGPFVKLCGGHEFSVAHYTGRVNYDARGMADKNKDFLPPEMISTMRASTSIAIQELFRNKLTKTGNLTVPTSQPKIGVNRTKSEKEIENQKARRYNTPSKGQFSQIHRMRTIAATYRATSLELLKQLAKGGGGVHFVRCIRPDLNDNPRGFQGEVVRQQLRALAILDTAKSRQNGFPCRIPFAEFIRRLYEIQVKKIVKVQSMMRTFLAKRKAAKSKSKMIHMKELQKQQSLTINEDEAALLIQKAYRGYIVRKAYGPLVSKSTGQIDEETASFLKRFAMKWKSRSIFQVLLQYRAVRYQDLVHFSQQVHIYNQAVVEGLMNTVTSVNLDRVNPQDKEKNFLGMGPPTVWKLPFRIDQLQYYDTSYMCQPGVNSNDTFSSQYDSDQEQWDEPLKRRFSPTQNQTSTSKTTTGTQTLIDVPYCRDPTQPLQKLPSTEDIEPQCVRNESLKGNRPTVYKKKPSQTTYYQAPTPWTANDENGILENSAPKLRKTQYSKSLYGVNLPDMQEPIKELQALAKSTNNLNDDDPPFNFQAMLRKTPRNRASMKRSSERESNEEAPPREIAKVEHVNSESPTPQKQINSKGPAPQPPKKEFTRKSSKELIKTALQKRNSSSDIACPVGDNKTEPEKIQLAPGIIVEGVVTDL